ncbi:hypothetical protein C0991_008276 [Blastosporella zonata]|nr:hypothetical protein C0991_008276 [Blastosporella zonata]
MIIAAAHARSQGEAPKRVEDVLVGSIAAPLVQSASIDVYANPQYITVDEKATKDIFQSRSPLPFQTTIPTHRHARSSPTNAHGPHVPQASQHSTSASTSASSQPSARGASVFQFGRRKGLGWSGEWNQDMEEVVKNLRNLKAR